MIKSAVKIILGVAITGGVAVAACLIANDRYVDTGDAVARACAGMPATPQLENALFNVRARSDSGNDPICSPEAVDDDLDGLALSRSPGSRSSAARVPPN